MAARDGSVVTTMEATTRRQPTPCMPVSVSPSTANASSSENGVSRMLMSDALVEPMRLIAASSRNTGSTVHRSAIAKLIPHCRGDMPRSGGSCVGNSTTHRSALTALMVNVSVSCSSFATVFCPMIM